MSSNRIEITREEFVELYRIVPETNLVGMLLLNADRNEIVAEYVFVDERNQSTQAEIDSLEKLYAQ